MAGGFLFWGREEEQLRQTEVLSLAEPYSTWDRRGGARDTWNTRQSVRGISTASGCFFGFAESHRNSDPRKGQNDKAEVKERGDWCPVSAVL